MKKVFMDMKKAFVFIAVAMLLFVGCGGGGGSSSSGGGNQGGNSNSGNNNGDLTVTMVEDYFSSIPFPDSEYADSLMNIQTGKAYLIADQAEENKFITRFESRGFDSQNATFYLKSTDLPSGMNVAVASFVPSNTEKLMALSLISDYLVADNTDFADVFGAVAKVTSMAFIYRHYSEDISSKFDDYAVMTLNSKGFNCQKPSDGDWSCEKQDGDKKYYWGTIGSDTYVHQVSKL